MTDEDIPISPSSTHKSCTSERPPLSLQALARVVGFPCGSSKTIEQISPGRAQARQHHREIASGWCRRPLLVYPFDSSLMRGHQSRATARATGSLSTGCHPRW